jgi:hypothetical protein
MLAVQYNSGNSVICAMFVDLGVGIRREGIKKAIPDISLVDETRNTKRVEKTSRMAHMNIEALVLHDARATPRE